MEFDLAQTFFVDKDAVSLADTCFITSVDLFFKTKPVAGKTTTGIYKPGVSVYVCPVDNDVPSLTAVYPEVARVEYDNIYESSIASTSTTFTFNFPIPIKTNQSYAILIKFDGSDNDFKLWWNKAGEKVLNTTNVTQVSSGKVDGFFYTITNGKQLTALRDADLKFNLKIAKFTSTSSTFRLHNNSNEFIKFYSDSISGNFRGGEYVWQNNAPSTGTVSVNTSSYAVIGNGTSFTSTLSVGDKFVVTDGTLGNADVRAVTTVANNTYLTVDVPFSFSNASGSYIKTPVGIVYDVNAMTDRLVLEDSTANSTVYFTSNSYVNGVDSTASIRIETVEDYEVNYIRPSFNIFTPAGTTTNVAINIANSSYAKASTRQVPAENGQIKFIDSYPAVFASRSNEVLNGATLFDDAKSFETELTFTTTNVYTSPYAKEENLDAFVTRYVINNSSADEYRSIGNASSKYVSKRVVLADGQDAEDIRVYVSAYKPANTEVEIYAKFHNATDPDPFDDKNWTKLELVTDRSILSNPFNRNDVIEFEYKVPTYHSGTAVPGLFTNGGTGVITGTSGTVNTDITIGDVVRVYQPIFPNNHFVAVVTAANTTTFTVADSTAYSNASMTTSGLQVEKITEENSAFENVQNNRIIRYFNSSGAAYDGYKTFAVKVVLLSSSDYRVPHINDLRAIAVSA
jgi:hypothetical protein